MLRNTSIAFLFLMILCCQLYAESTRVAFTKNGLTIHAQRIALGDLLETVAEATGVQFVVDKEVARTTVTLDFEDAPLSDGIKRILSSQNHAMIEDDAGRLSRVFVFGQGKEAVTFGDHEPGEDYREDPERDRTERADLGSRRRRTVSRTSRDIPPEQEEDSADLDELFEEANTAEEEPIASEDEDSYVLLDREEQTSSGPPISQDQEFDGPPDSETQHHEGPPKAEIHTSDEPPESHDQPLDGPPVDVTVDNPPPSSSGGGEMDGPPQD